jgi:hypothetical protein
MLRLWKNGQTRPFFFGPRGLDRKMAICIMASTFISVAMPMEAGGFSEE